jgi:hypothetical protein
MHHARLTLLTLLAPAAFIVACGSSSSSTGTGGGGSDTTSTSGSTSSSSSSSGTGGASTTSSSSSSSTGAGGSGGGSTGNYACIGSVVWKTPSTPTISVPLQLADVQTNAGVSGADVKACGKADATCASPLTTGKSDTMGNLTLTLDAGTTGFDGYFDIKQSSYVPTLLYFGHPLFDDTAELGPLVSTASFGLLGTLLGVQPDPARGHMTLLALDCDGHTADGVTFAVSAGDAKTKTFYVEGSLPSSTATETDGSGGAIVVNVPAGMVTITATIASSKKQIGKADVLVRAGSITAKGVEPTP